LNDEFGCNPLRDLARNHEGDEGRRPADRGRLRRHVPEAHGRGALTVREKELIALAIGMAVRCEPCIYAHAEKAVKAGATRDQLIELAGVVVMMQGGPGYVHVPELLDAMETLGV
jgi:AhpD family alkylhydroperoxidase